MVRNEQVKALLFDYMKPSVHEAMDIATIRAINAAFHKYQDDQEAKEYRTILFLLTSKIKCSYYDHCLNWLRMNCNTTWTTYYQNFNLSVRFLCVCVLKRGKYVNDDDVKRVTGWKMNIYMIRSAMLRSGLVDRQPKTSLVRINDKGRKLLALVLEAIEIEQNNINNLVHNNTL